MVRDSRVHGLADNLYIADAMAVTGATDGWTSFNARVAGALAAHRALRRARDLCTDLKQTYQARTCCEQRHEGYCQNVESEYHRESCCSRR